MSSAEESNNDESTDREGPDHYKLEGIYDDDDKKEQFTIFDPSKDTMTNWISTDDDTVMDLNNKR